MGPPSALGVCVVESPGREEAAQGTPLVGPTGQTFDEELLRAGLLRSKLFIVNAICCQPPPHKSDTEMHKAVDCCAPAFKKQMDQFRPSIPKFLMGKWAIYAVMGKNLQGGIEKGRGFLRPDPVKTVEDVEQFLRETRKK